MVARPVYLAVVVRRRREKHARRFFLPLSVPSTKSTNSLVPHENPWPRRAATKKPQPSKNRPTMAVRAQKNR